jgi:hypothetical protein
MSLENFAEIYGKIPSHVCYAENVWPVIFDFIPNNVFNWQRYDINLNFGNIDDKKLK